jgi:hypothetical protein
MSANRDEIRGQRAFREGRPFVLNENVDWQFGWSSARDDAASGDGTGRDPSPTGQLRDEEK